MRFFSQLNSATAGRSRAGLALAVCALLQDAACGGNTPIQPPPPPPALTLSCPAPLDSEATSPDGAAVDFDMPQPMGGSPPYIVQCAPPSGSIFAAGDTTIECAASDAGMAQASCSFVVTVRISEELTRSKFMAFGDSITAGEFHRRLLLRFVTRSRPIRTSSRDARARYPAQDSW